jgi:hypothetical protein
MKKRKKRNAFCQYNQNYTANIIFGVDKQDKNAEEPTIKETITIPSNGISSS